MSETFGTILSESGNKIVILKSAAENSHASMEHVSTGCEFCHEL